MEKIVGGGDVQDSYCESLKLTYRGILVEQAVDGGICWTAVGVLP